MVLTIIAIFILRIYLMLRAALLRRSCDGVAAATESLLRGSRCCDGDAQTSSVALILRVASRRDALNEEPASFAPGGFKFQFVAHSPRPPPWPRNSFHQHAMLSLCRASSLRAFSRHAVLSRRCLSTAPAKSEMELLETLLEQTKARAPPAQPPLPHPPSRLAQLPRRLPA